MATGTEQSSTLWSAPATETAILEAMADDLLYDSPTSVRILTRDQTLEGGTLLSGFQLPLSKLFEKISAAEETPV